MVSSSVILCKACQHMFKTTYDVDLQAKYGGSGEVLSTCPNCRTVLSLSGYPFEPPAYVRIKK